MCNEGSAWGIIEDPATIKIISVSLLFIISYLWYTAKDTMFKVGLGLMFLGGALNLGERIYHGCVMDYIKLADWWPSFNVADALIAAGLFIVILGVLLRRS